MSDDLLEVMPWGEILLEWLEANGKTIHWLSEQLDIRWAVAHRMCYDSPDIPMTPELASSIAGVTGLTVQFWLNLDDQWRQAIKVAHAHASGEVE